MKGLNTCILLSIIVVSLFPLITMPPAMAAQGQAKVYIICLSGVGGWWVDNPSRVKDGATLALSPKESINIPSVHPKYGKAPPFYNVRYKVVTDWATYKNVIESYKEVMVLNTHGEILPIPSGYTEIQLVDKIADAMLHRRVSWVHIAGYPFYRVWHQGAGSSQEWPSGGPFGFKNLTSHINMPNVDCWPSGSSTEPVRLNPTAEGQLQSGWGELHHAFWVQLGRPLKSSDFKEYLIMPIHGSEPCYTSAVIAFAKPGQRFNPSDQYGFGTYVHIGTDQTFEYDGVTPTDKDFYRGYVGAAAAVWAEMQSLHGRGEKTTTSECELAVFAKPLISNYWRGLDETWHIELSFGVYACLKSCSYFGDPKVWIQKAEVTVRDIPTGCQMQLRQSESKNGYGDNPTLNGIFTSESKLIAEALLFILALDPEVGFIALFPEGVLLFSDWMEIALGEKRRGIDKPDSVVEFSYPPVIEQKKIGDYWYEEFESIITIELQVPRAGRDQWSIIPLRWDIKVFPSLGGITARVWGGISVAAYNAYVPTNFTTTVFFEDFEDDMSGWSVGDNDPSAGYDYWGRNSYNTTDPCHVWCAWVGDNSVKNEPNREHMFYDKNMKAYLTRAIDLRSYRQAFLLFEVYNFLVRDGYDDRLKVQYYANDVWSDIDSPFSNTMHAWQIKGPYNMPNNIKYIRFLFESDGDDIIDCGSGLDNIEIRGILPNDAGTQSDAGNTLTEATFMTVSDTLKNYAGYLDSTPDCYKFTVTSSDLGNKYVRVNLNIPQNTEFFVELYDLSGNWKAGPAGPSEYSSLFYNLKTSDTPGNWTIKIYSTNGFGQYNFDIGVLPGRIGGCPFVYVWNGQEYVVDNNLLPASAESGGTDTEDFYRLEQTLAPVYQNPLISLYSFQIREFQKEHSYLDQVRLLAVNHQQDVNVAVSPNGEILTYRNSHPPLSCANKYGYNVLETIQFIDQEYYQGYTGDYLILNFGNLNIQDGAKLVMRADIEDIKESILIQILNQTESWQTVAKVIPRVYWATEIINLTNYLPDTSGKLQIRLYFTAPHKLDYVGLDTTPQADITIHNSLLTSAIHSQHGIITSKLLCNDQTYAELLPKQQISLLFILANKQNQTTLTTFIFYVEGHYNTIP